MLFTGTTSTLRGKEACALPEVRVMVSRGRDSRYGSLDARTESADAYVIGDVLGLDGDFDGIFLILIEGEA